MRWRCLVFAIHNQLTQIRQRFIVFHPPISALGEDGLQVAFEQGAGVLQVLFGVGFGSGDGDKRFVENADDALLFGDAGERDWKLFKMS